MDTPYVQHQYTVNYGMNSQPWSINSNNSSSILEGDEELLILDNSRLDFVDDSFAEREEDFCRCNKCRKTSIAMISNGNITEDHSTRTDRNGVEPSSVRDTHRHNHYRSVDANSNHDNHHIWLNHCHINTAHSNDSRSQSVNKAKRQLIVGSVLCLVFMLAEIIGGYVSNSLAIMTDAAHLLSDLASFGLSLFAIWLSQKPPTKRMSFGYYRAEVLGAVASIFIIWVLTGILIYLAVDRIRFEDYEIDTNVMIIVSGLGVAINIIMGITLSGGFCHKKHTNDLEGSHSHNSLEEQHQHRPQRTAATLHGHSHDNINVKAALIHVLGDLIQSVGVLVAALIIHYKPEAKLADPICTFIFSGLVLFTTFNIMKSAVYVLMEGFPSHLEYSAIKDALQRLDGVRNTHSLHIWSLTMDRSALSVHLAVDPNLDPENILKLAENLIRNEYDIQHTTIQVERYDPRIMNECNTCKGP